MNDDKTYRVLQTAEEVNELITDELLNSAVDWFDDSPTMPVDEFFDRLFPIRVTTDEFLELEDMDNAAARRILSRARKLRKEREL